VYLLATSLAQVAFSLSIFSLLLSNRHLLASFGFAPSLAAKLAHPVAPPVGPTVIALYLASTLFSPLSSLLKFVTNLVTRRLEYDADAFAAKLGGSYARNLKQALVTIHEKNLVRLPASLSLCLLRSESSLSDAPIDCAAYRRSTASTTSTLPSTTTTRRSSSASRHLTHSSTRQARRRWSRGYA